VLALVYDVHGNLPALEAVLADAQEAGAQRYLLGGDYCLFGAWPLEVLERLRTLDATWLRGNGERWSADSSDSPPREPLQSGLQACREILDPTTVSELADLPQSLALDGVLYCHASPHSDVLGFQPEASDDDASLLEGVHERRVVFGHTHFQFRRVSAGGVELVNAGSVGLPFDDDPRAGYALLRDDSTFELRRVAYDHHASAAALRERFGPWAETVAQRVELARLVYAP